MHSLRPTTNTTTYAHLLLLPLVDLLFLWWCIFLTPDIAAGRFSSLIAYVLHRQWPSGWRRRVGSRFYCHKLPTEPTHTGRFVIGVRYKKRFHQENLFSVSIWLKRMEEAKEMWPDDRWRFLVFVVVFVLSCQKWRIHASWLFWKEWLSVWCVVPCR